MRKDWKVVVLVVVASITSSVTLYAVSYLHTLYVTNQYSKPLNPEYLKWQKEKYWPDSRPFEDLPMGETPSTRPKHSLD